MKISCVYRIYNKISNKSYIGSTVNWQKRKTSHINQLRKSKHYNRHLQSAWNKYGEQVFEFAILEEIEPSRLINAEINFIELYRAHIRDFGYNEKSPNSSRAGLVHSAESLEKISKNRTGIGHKEHIKKQISESLVKVAKNRSQVQYDKMAATKKGKPIPSLNKKVKCVELDKIFNSIQEAANELKVHRTGISMVLNGTMNKTGGYSFIRVD